MAKKKDDTPGPTSATLSVLAQIEREYGKVVQSGVETINEKRAVIPVSPAVDSITDGGVPEGTWVTAAGKYGSGKSTTALRLAANAQRPEFGGRSVYYLDVEGRLDAKLMGGVRGLNPEPPLFNHIVSTPDRILSAEDFLEIGTLALNGDHGCVLIIDSPSAFCTEGNRSEGVRAVDRGSANKAFGTFIRQNAQVVRVRKSIVWSSLHLVQTQSQYGTGWTEKVAELMKYVSSTMLRIRYTQDWRVGPKDKSILIGQRLFWEVDKAALGAPGRQAEGYIRYGIGLDDTQELIGPAVDFGLIEKSGTWYSLSYLGENPPKVQGLEKVWEIIDADPEKVAKLREALKAFR